VRFLHDSTVSVIRTILLLALAAGLLGTGAELLFLGHYEDWWQIVPLVLIALALVLFAWHLLHRSPLPLRALQALMALFALAGVAGVILHYLGNVEWERETSPGIAGMKLVWGALTGAIPALAPGQMIQLALVGLAYSFRHPLLVQASEPEERLG
jgi:FtsH-binding integral membrane protein